MHTDDPRHGTTPGYHAGCRDLCCRRAIARYEKIGRLNRQQDTPRAIPAQGAQRRIQALMALGWTSTDIAQAAGIENRNNVLRILNGQSGRPCRYITRPTHDRIIAVYERLAMQLPPAAPYRTRTRRHAARRGYVPPLGWADIDTDLEPVAAVQVTDIDPVVVMRLLQGDRVTSTRAEKEAAMAQWIDQGGVQAELCRWHGWHQGRYGTRLALADDAAS